jgi:hypothetical protein
MFVGRESSNKREIKVRPFFRWDAFMNNSGTELRLEQIQERQMSFLKLIERLKHHQQDVGRTKGLSLEYFAQEGDAIYPPLNP